uniref:Uncharacterized protein n=1 Tax=Anguilla anguilla TaxID=7936 RepID=A0A0E9WQ68_ANGAN
MEPYYWQKAVYVLGWQVCSWHFSGFPTEITTMTTHSQPLKTLISAPSELMSTDGSHHKLIEEICKIKTALCFIFNL